MNRSNIRLSPDFLLVQTRSPIVDLICIDDFFMGDGAHGRRTQQLGIRDKYEELGYSDWYHPEAYQVVVRRMRKVYDTHQVQISQEGFAPFEN